MRDRASSVGLKIKVVVWRILLAQRKSRCVGAYEAVRLCPKVVERIAGGGRTGGADVQEYETRC